MQDVSVPPSAVDVVNGGSPKQTPEQGNALTRPHEASDEGAVQSCGVGICIGNQV